MAVCAEGVVEGKPVQPPGLLRFVLVLKTPVKRSPTRKIHQTALNIQASRQKQNLQGI